MTRRRSNTNENRPLLAHLNEVAQHKNDLDQSNIEMNLYREEEDKDDEEKRTMVRYSSDDVVATSEHGIGSVGISLASDGQTTIENETGLNQTKIVIVSLLLILLVLVIVDFLMNGEIKGEILHFLDWIETNPISGIFVFTFLYFVCTVLFIPGTVLTIGSGFAFANAFGLGPGVLLASLSVCVGASTGAMAAFLLGRYLLRDWVKSLTKDYLLFLAVDKAVEKNGFRIMVLLRLSPIIPFIVLNYIGGITSIPFSSFSFALVGMLPGTVLIVFWGASAGSLAGTGSGIGSSDDGDESNFVIILSAIFGTIIGGLAIFFISVHARQELRKMIEQQ